MLRFLVRPPLCVAFCLAALSLSSVSAEEKSDKKIEAPFVHVALYTFKADAPTGTAEEFADEAEKCFAQIDSVRSFRIGKPAAKATPREFMVDPKHAYHLGVVLTFDNFDGMAKYGNDRQHNALKKKYAKHFEKIVAYDFTSTDESQPNRKERATSEVFGRVTLNGKPLDTGRIQIHLSNGQFVGASLNEDGTYSLQVVPTGIHAVSFSGKFLPAKYSDEKSGLQIRVQPGANTQDFDLRISR